MRRLLFVRKMMTNNLREYAIIVSADSAREKYRKIIERIANSFGNLQWKYQKNYSAKLEHAFTRMFSGTDFCPAGVETVLRFPDVNYPVLPDIGRKRRGNMSPVPFS